MYLGYLAHSWPPAERLSVAGTAHAQNPPWGNPHRKGTTLPRQRSVELLNKLSYGKKNEYTVCVACVKLDSSVFNLSSQCSVSLCPLGRLRCVLSVLSVLSRALAVPPAAC